MRLRVTLGELDWAVSWALGPRSYGAAEHLTYKGSVKGVAMLILVSFLIVASVDYSMK